MWFRPRLDGPGAFFAFVGALLGLALFGTRWRWGGLVLVFLIGWFVALCVWRSYLPGS